jgi:DNA-binding IclR family transcriptional regulator
MHPTRQLATSLIKGLDVLGLVARHPDGITLAELGSLLTMPRTSILRILVTLEHYGLVERNEKNFLPTAQFRQWSSGDPDRVLRETHHAALNTICEATGELVMIGVLDGGKLRQVDHAQGRQVIRVDPVLAAAHALETAAMGKLLLSQRPDLAARIKTPRIRKELEEAIRTGVAWNREESAPGIIAVATWAGKPSPATPVISVSWPVFRFTEAKAQEAIKCMHKLYPNRSV